MSDYPMASARASCVAAAAAFVFCTSLGSAQADAQHIYVREIPNAEVWQAYSKPLGTERFGKFIIDIRSGDIYFIDVNVFNLHADFVLGVLLKQAWTAEDIR